MALLFLLGTAVSCKKQVDTPYVDPVVNNPITDYDITRDPADYFSFTFKNKSTNFTKLEWRFGDDTLKTVTDPTHTYLRTGKYTVDLKAFSNTNATTRKLVDLNIVPDSIIKVTSTRTSFVNSEATLKFDIKVNAPVKTMVWKFDDVAYTPPGGTQVGAKSETFTYTDGTSAPTRKYFAGTFNTITITLTTTKGSVTTITRGVTTEGIAEDITPKRKEYKTFYEHASGATSGEGSSKLLDNNVGSKFGVYSRGTSINKWEFTIIYDAPVKVNLYMIANANDSGDSRDPREWYLDGSNDGITWVQLDYQNNGAGFYSKARDAGITAEGTSSSPGRYFRKWYYPIPVQNQQAVTMYRLRFPGGAFGNDAIQLSEFALYR
ncbi:hypothetical protein GCM10028827_23070 [Mucilaginibacter myungsuensis]